MSRDDFDTRVGALAALGEPVRRALYRYVVAQPGPVNRDQAAEGVGVARHVAKFHLDKLVGDGLLEVEFSRPPGRRGPGAGRPTKFYKRSSTELEVSLPPRRYELAARLLARAVSHAKRDGAPIGEALSGSAREAGRSLGQEARQRAGSRPRQSALLAAASEVLAECGYEPRTDASGITMANCPFHALREDHTEVVCGMNLALMEGLVGGLERATLEARLDPAPDRCCVRLQKPVRR